MMRNNISIKHIKNNHQEIRFCNYMVDGYCFSTKTVYEFRIE